jgi:3-hydroxyisobutyrate dehydrogenase-like beta-hydroxyacid dehydrogenase
VARRPAEGLRIAVLGLGEAGRRLAADLASLGAAVAGWDPAVREAPAGVELAAGAAEAVAGSEVVLSVNAASAALAAAREAAPALAPGALFADLNTGAPGLKRSVAAVVEPAGAQFADVALLAPVPRRGLATPALVSGGGAGRFAAVFRPLGMPVEELGPEPGVAAQRKLLRSVFVKGLAAAVVESLEAASAAGCGDWLRASIASTLDAADASLLDRFEDGSRAHAGRRVEEMEAACDLLRELGVEPRVAAAAAAQLAALRETAPAGAR